jgi:hypothetical protein
MAWLVRYLDRQLASKESAWFESYAMDKPVLLAKIEADTRLRDALAADATARHTERFAAREPPGRSDKLRLSRKARRSSRVDVASASAGLPQHRPRNSAARKRLDPLRPALRR